MTDPKHGPQPLDPSAAPWQHYLLTLSGPRAPGQAHGPFESLTEQQRKGFLSLGPAGWELVSATTLHSGHLLLAFKREWSPDGAPPPDDHDEPAGGWEGYL